MNEPAGRPTNHPSSLGPLFAGKRGYVPTEPPAATPAKPGPHTPEPDAPPPAVPARARTHSPKARWVSEQERRTQRSTPMARTKTTPRPQPPAEPAPPRLARRGDRGLTTLEWLLIVAAVAGLAALAVVLVQNVVDETAEQISGSNARITAARVAAAEITDDTKTAFDKVDGDDTKETAANADGKAKCDRLQITYGDAFEAEDMKAIWQPTSGDYQDNSKTEYKTGVVPAPNAAQGCYVK